MFQAQRKNKIKTGVIVTVIFLFVSVAVYFISYYAGYGEYAFIIAILVSMCLSLGAYWFSDKMVLAMSRARPANEQEEKYIGEIIEGLCIASGLPRPRLYIVDDHSPNAFATGRNPKNSVVCVTTGLLGIMNRYELEGVLSHEMAHIKNRDILLQTVASIMIGAVLILSDVVLRMMWFGGMRRNNSRDNNNGGANAIFMLIGLVFLILSPILGQLMKMALSRNREYLADATGAEFTRNPEGLASALEKLGRVHEPLHAANSATENLYIVTPWKAVKDKTSNDWFSTHPPIEKRVEALRHLR